MFPKHFLFLFLDNCWPSYGTFVVLAKIIPWALYKVNRGGIYYIKWSYFCEFLAFRGPNHYFKFFGWRNLKWPKWPLKKICNFLDLGVQIGIFSFLHFLLMARFLPKPEKCHISAKIFPRTKTTSKKVEDKKVPLEFDYLDYLYD